MWMSLGRGQARVDSLVGGAQEHHATVQCQTYPLLPGLPNQLIEPVATIWIRKNTSVPSQKPILSYLGTAVRVTLKSP